MGRPDLMEIASDSFASFAFCLLLHSSNRCRFKIQMAVMHILGVNDSMWLFKHFGYCFAPISKKSFNSWKDLYLRYTSTVSLEMTA